MGGFLYAVFVFSKSQLNVDMVVVADGGAAVEADFALALQT